MAVWVVRVLDGQDPPPGPSRFPDANSQLPRFWPPFIERMAELGVTQGCGDGTNFCPLDPVTRAQMAVFLTRAFNLPAGPDPDFSDVPNGAWYEDQVAALAASGITLGCSDTMFCPSRDTTRGQMATFLYRANQRAMRLQAAVDVLSPRQDSSANTQNGVPTLNFIGPALSIFCPQSPIPPDLSDTAVILRINSNGCMSVTYEPLAGRTIQEIRREYASDPDVIAVDRARAYTNDNVQQELDPDDEFHQWHYEAVEAHILTSVEWPNAADIRVAVIDGGVDMDHPELEDRFEPGYDLNFDNSTGEDVDGHGTNIAAIIAADSDNLKYGKGIAPNAKVVSFKGVSCDFLCISGTEALLARAIQDPEIDIINMSYGSLSAADDEECSTVVANLAEIANQVAKVLVASAGNDGKNLGGDERHYPSGCPDVIEVAATNRNNELVKRYNYGPEVVLAPGWEIATIKRISEGGGKETVSGTSIAAPMVVGVAAHLMAWFPNATGEQIKRAIEESASHGSSPDSELGFGRIQPLEAIRHLDKQFETQVYARFTEPPPPSEITVHVSVGDRVQGDSSCSTSSCRWLHVEIEGDIEATLGSGPYTLACAHNGVFQEGFTRGVYDSALMHDTSSTRDCFFGYPGNQVFVVVGAELRGETWYGGHYSTSVDWPAAPPAILSLEISWGGDGSGRSICPENTECRNLSYRYIGDWPDPPYDIECRVNNQGGSRFWWLGRPHTGCMYWLYTGTNLTAQAVIYNVSTGPIRSNILSWNDAIPEPEAEPPEPEAEPEVILTVGDSAQGGGRCSSVHCRWLHIEISNFGPGPHILLCAHDENHHTGESRGAWESEEIYESDSPITRSCFFGYPDVEVFVVVGATRDGDSWVGGVYSNVIKWPRGNA